MSKLRYITLVLILVLLSVCSIVASPDSFLRIRTTGTITAPLPESSLALTVVGHEFHNAEGEAVFLRGVGVAHDMDDVRGWWTGPGDHYVLDGRWETDVALLTQRIDANLAALTLWGGNALRVFVAVNWWWQDSINPSHYETGAPNEVMSYRDYFELLVQRAQGAGVYVLFCPYELESYAEGNGGFGGLPVQGGPDARGQAVLADICEGDASCLADTTYTEPMRRWWRSVTARLGGYPNVLFEIWNEPDHVDRNAWFTHQIEMYQTIRQGTSNVILFMWRMGAVPGYQEELTWIPLFHTQLTAALGGNTPVNVGYDFHAYRYEWNGWAWGTSYATVLNQLNGTSWLQATRPPTGAVHVPVLCAETGMGLDASNLADERGWWDGLLRACNELGVGYCAYYWMPSDMGWTPEQGLFTADSAHYWPQGYAAPIPSLAGDIFLTNDPAGAT